MHLLQAKPGEITDGSEAVDLQQTPADVVILSAADTDLSSLAAARAHLDRHLDGNLDRAPTLRLANLMQLGHPMSMDLYVEQTLQSSRLIIARVLGGVSYFSYGIEQLQVLARERGIPIALLPGDDHPDPELMARSTLPTEACHRLWQYLVHGGHANAQQLLRYTASLLGHDNEWHEPAPLPRAGLHWPTAKPRNIDELRQQWAKLETPNDAAAVAIIFYRSLLQAGSTGPIDALIEALASRSINAVPIYCTSLKDPACADTVASLLDEASADLVLNATGFSLSSPGGARKSTPFDDRDCPVLQIVFSGSSQSAWQDGNSGLSARDIAMNVALPEVDGRIITRAVSFKSEARRDPQTQCSVVHYQALQDRIDFTAELAQRWIELRRCDVSARRIAIVLANYPTRDGRIGNGVGLDTPAATVQVLHSMREAGYAVRDIPEHGNALIERLQSGPTNAAVLERIVQHWLTLDDYQRGFANLPATLREQLSERWGAPHEDPFFDANEQAFAIPAFCCGEIIIGLQPARGYHIDPVRSYHDPALIPPHGYLAFYFWLNDVRAVHAITHMGKHGNLEWLPGKSLALSAQCWPEAVLGAVPHIYPFIVNDPGEGTQAKRRSQAVIIDHLTPPLTRAESYGPLADLEQLVDEYYEAAGVDPRRITLLREQILQLARRVGLDKDCGVGASDDDETALGKLDNHLCELKELQIRDGLHIFGCSPDGDQLTDLLIALTRLPRGDGNGANASIIRALAADLGLSEFDPLDCRLADAWHGSKPPALTNALNSDSSTDRAKTSAWRTAGDTVERLEGLARSLVAGNRKVQPDWAATRDVLEQIEHTIGPAVGACGASEINGLLTGLDGRFVAPGPSGAPSRGRPEVLPTGRNFYSVDTRTVPTPAAWTLGWHSATLLIEQYRQDHGEWPERMALSAWGTANMRTGGDDIAQALALMGVQPTWEVSSRRVTGFEIMPLDLLDRPRVDVTLRISGFFRDAFPAQIALFDSAARAVAALDEDPAHNPLAARVKRDSQDLIDTGIDETSAQQRAGFRVFGSQPGAYGAGLQALIDEKGWQSADDLARAYVAWGGYAYGNGAEGDAEHGLFERRLCAVQAVIHNQDNREHDLLDSDDYYQFEGGMTAAVTLLANKRPKVYHNDHSRPHRPVIRSLEEEIARVVRARVVNPKWIEGVMRHGYKGAFEMAATVDYLFAFSATTGAVGDHHFDAVYEAYLEDDRVREFLANNNPAALGEIADRLLEAQERGLWTPRSNSAHVHLHSLRRGN
ncbi:MAG: cobaltochelatase CobN [Gammaproteobacteria bacterium]|jgi:cobaltochelatase CobN